MSKRSVDKENKGKKAVEPKAAKVPLNTSKGPVQEPESGLKANLYWYAGLFLAFLFSFYLRAIRPMGSVFVGDTVRFSSETDSWYHMMLAKGTIINLQRLWYDPMTNFPYGTALHFGPFVSWTITIFSYIFGLGHPSAHTIEVIGALLPAVLGALLVFPVYLLGKELGGRSGGLISALIIAVLPGTLFARTSLGFTDHHASEIFLSTLTMAFFLMAVRSGRGMTFASVQKSWSDFKMPLLYSALAGISLGLYIDAWSSGFLFEGIILAFIFIQSVTDHLKDRSIEHLSISGAITFFMATLLVLPFVKLYNGFSNYMYSLFHPTILILGIIAVILISFLSKFLAKKEVSRYYYPGVLAGIAVLGTAMLTLIAPQFTRPLFYGLTIMFQARTGGAATVGEASPFFEYGGEFSMANMQLNFPGVANIVILSPFFLAIAALVVLLVRYIRNDQKPTDLAIITWSVIILILTLAQNRFAYYYAVDVAILMGFLAIWVLQKVGFNELDKWSIDTKDTAKLLNNLKILLVAVVIFVVAIFPGLQMSMAVSQYPSTLYNEYPDWITSANWLKDNTPSPGLDLYKIYNYPTSGKFSYPDTAYGVMSWWDYGHIIEVIGGRLPNANPFQQGIGSVTRSIPGSSPFFLAENESQAEKVLKDLDKGRSQYMNTRYIMMDWEMATGKFYAMTAWSGIPITKYYGVFYQPQGDKLVPVSVFRDSFFNTMTARLFFFDGSETPVTDAIGIAYQIADQDGMKFSVITETPKISKNYSELVDYVSQSKSKGYLSEIVSKRAYTSMTSSVPLVALQHYRLVHESESVVTYDGQKDVKTFEHVPGAVIKGTAPAGTKVLIGVPIKTNRDREFNYIQSNTTDSKGEFTLVVPYSTEGPASWGTKFDTGPTGPYQLVVGDKVYEVKIPEEYVMSGSVIPVG